MASISFRAVAKSFVDPAKKNADGSYTITVAVTAGGKTVTQTIVVDVTSTPGSAPCG